MCASIKPELVPVIAFAGCLTLSACGSNTATSETTNSNVSQEASIDEESDSENTRTLDVATLQMELDSSTPPDRPVQLNVDAAREVEASSPHLDMALDPTSDQSTQDAEAVPFDFEGRQGALVTSNCQFEDYHYAVDILLSCGNERFNSELRLHTFKRHSYDHKQVFNDQRITFRNQHLWFDGYDTPRCIRVNNARQFVLATEAHGCASFALVGTQDSFSIADSDTGLCATLGGAACDAHQSTGGFECGGREHRFLPLTMADCARALQFRFENMTEGCPNEFPQNDCF